MATFAARRTEMSAALTGEGVSLHDTWTGEPPYAMLFLNGSDLAPLVNGQASVQFRVVLVVSKADDAVSLAAVDAMANDAIRALVDLDGWRIDGMGPLQRVDVGPDRMYAVDVTVSTMVEFT